MNATFPAYYGPEPKTPLEHAAVAINWHSSQLRDLLALGRWDAERQAKEFGTSDWFERLKGQVIELEVVRRIKAIGPEGARVLTTKECLGHISAPALHKAASAYTNGSALLLGKTGFGKTLTAMLMARRFAASIERKALEGARELVDECSRNRSTPPTRVAWVSCAELPRLAASHPFGRGEPELLTSAKRAPLVVLDDLTWGDNDKALLEIIAYRYDHGLPSIATAGATRDELGRRFGDAAMRRLIEHRGVKGTLVEAF